MKNLKKLRMERHLSQQKLANEFQLSQQSIYKYENNLAEPDIQTMIDFAVFFHTSVDYLIGNTSQSPEKNGIADSALALDPTEAHLIHLFRGLPEKAQINLVTLAELLSDVQNGN